MTIKLPINVWVVYGEAGEYSDRYDWEIAAYLTEADAQAHADAAKKWFEETRHDECGFQISKDNPYDPGVTSDANWGIYPVELRSEFKPCG